MPETRNAFRSFIVILAGFIAVALGILLLAGPLQAGQFASLATTPAGVMLGLALIAALPGAFILMRRRI